MADGLPTYVVQNAGAATITYSYGANLVGSGVDNTLPKDTPVTLSGFKLNANYLDTQQALDNSVIIPLLDGGSIQITNANGAGRMTISAVRTGNSLAGGDIVAIATAQRKVAGGDSLGATINIQFSFNGINYTLQFIHCTVAQCKPVTLAGNDAPDYQVVFNYADWDFV